MIHVHIIPIPCSTNYANWILQFLTQDLDYLYNTENETGGALVPAQIIYDAFYGRFHNSAGAVFFMCIITGSFFFCGLSVFTTAARAVRKFETLNPPFFFLKLTINFILY